MRHLRSFMKECSDSLKRMASIEVLREYTEKKKKEKHQKGGNADRGLRVGFGGVGLVLSLPMVLDLCSNLCRNACLCDSSAAE